MTKVYVGNLPPNCSEKALRSYFENYGKIMECDIVNTYGFVHFSDNDEAKLAVDMLNNKEWDGVKLKVELSSTKLRPKPGMGKVCYGCGKPGHSLKMCPRKPNRTVASVVYTYGGRGRTRYYNYPYNYNDNNDSNNSDNSDPSSHENRTTSTNSENSCGNNGLFLQSKPLYDPNGYRHDSFRDSYQKSSSPSSLYYERNNDNAYSGCSNNDDDDSSKSENRDQSLCKNRDLYMKSENSHGNSGGFLQSDALGGYNGYRNDSFRDSYRESSSSNSLYYERNNSCSNHYENNRNNNKVGPSSDLDGNISRNNDSYYNNYTPPPQSQTRYRPYPSASKRLGPLPSPSGNSKPFMQSRLLSALVVTDYHHQNKKNLSNSHNNNDDINKNSSNRKFDPYARPPPEYYERRRGMLRMSDQDGWGK